VSAGEIAVRAVVAIGLMLVIAALVYAVSGGHILLFPLLLVLAFPLVALFRRPPPPPTPPQSPPRISMN
jgi:hypothetical protein